MRERGDNDVLVANFFYLDVKNIVKHDNHFSNYSSGILFFFSLTGEFNLRQSTLGIVTGNSNYSFA